MKKAIDVNDLEAQFAKKPLKPLNKSFIVGGSEDEDEDDGIIEFNDNAVVIEPIKFSTTTKNDNNLPVPVSYASTLNTGNNLNQSKSMTVEELEAQFRSGVTVSPKSPTSQLVGAGPPPGLPPGLSNGPIVGNSNGLSVTNSLILPSGNITTCTSNTMSSTAPLPKNDPNREFMNRFERNLIMKIHTTQLTTETPLMDDFYYQALTKKRTTESVGAGAGGNLLYFPLPSAAERQRELQRRERRRRQREKERAAEKGKEKEKERVSEPLVNSEINADLVLGKVSNSSSRKPRQQLQVPSGVLSNTNSGNPTSLHESVMKGIESVYNSILSVEDFYLIQEELESRTINENEEVTYAKKLTLPDFDELIKEANEVFCNELNLIELDPTKSGLTNHKFIHFLTIPKGRLAISRVLKLLNEEGKRKFLRNLVEYFDFLDIVRPETSLNTIDSFILQVLSPLVGFVGEADWKSVLEALNSLFAKRSFVWIALTKAGMVLLCILLSRLEILKATGQDEDVTNTNFTAFIDESSALTEKMFDSLEGHLLEFFSSSDPNRDFYAWQCLALLAMNVESDRKRTMILELRDKILVVVEQEDETALKNLNVFLNALGLDASQLK